MNKFHVPDHQWEKQKRKQRLKGKKKDRKKQLHGEHLTWHGGTKYSDDYNDDEQYRQ